MSEEKYLKVKPSTEDIIIPKHRFDEINNKYKALRNEYLILEEESKKKDTQIDNLLKRLEALKLGYEKELNTLKVKEIFVEGGIIKEQYDTIIPKMTCEENERLDLARAIVNLINNK